MTGPEVLEGAWPRPERVLVRVPTQIMKPEVREHSPDNPHCPWNVDDAAALVSFCTCPVKEDK